MVPVLRCCHSCRAMYLASHLRPRPHSYVQQNLVAGGLMAPPPDRRPPDDETAEPLRQPHVGSAPQGLTPVRQHTLRMWR
jgi:hypothetical protein